MAKVTVLGIGNVLMTDEGVGVRLMEAVRDARHWPDDVAFIDGGAGGLGLLNVIEAAQSLVVFDAAEMHLPPGRHRAIAPEQIAPEPAAARISLHDAPFAETLRLCEQFLRRPREVRILAVQPKTLRPGRGLSPELEAAFDRLVRAGVELVAAACSGAP